MPLHQTIGSKLQYFFLAYRQVIVTIYRIFSVNSEIVDGIYNPYNQGLSHSQNFPINTEALEFPLSLDEAEDVYRLPSYRYIKLGIVSNHGHPDYTCLYRFRVHGQVVQE